MIVFIILLAVFLFIVFLDIGVRLIIEKKPNKDLLLILKVWNFKYNIDIKKLLKRDELRKKTEFEIKLHLEQIKYILSKSRFQITKLNLYVGFEDAAFLAVFCGLLNTVIYSVIALLKNASIQDKNNLSITPIFNKNYFELKFECIIKIKLRNIIIGYIFKKRK